MIAPEARSLIRSVHIRALSHDYQSYIAFRVLRNKFKYISETMVILVENILALSQSDWRTRKNCCRNGKCEGEHYDMYFKHVMDNGANIILVCQPVEDTQHSRVL